MDKKSGDRYEMTQCMFHDTNCEGAGDKCVAEKVDLEMYEEKDVLGLHEKK